MVIGRDGLIRRAVIKYFNASENDPENAKYHHQLTDRAVRKLIKLWSVDESCLFDDLAELQGRMDGPRNPVNDDGAPPDALLADEEVSLFLGYSGPADLGCVGVDAGPGYVLLDGEHLDLASYTTSCDLTSLMMQPVLHPRQMDMDQGQDSEQEEENLDTLTRLLVSTGFSLD